MECHELKARSLYISTLGKIGNDYIDYTNYGISGTRTVRERKLTVGGDTVLTIIEIISASNSESVSCL